MTEAEWTTSNDPERMLKFAGGRLSSRRCRLYAVECCRRVGHLLPDTRSHTALEVIESHLEGMASDQELLTASMSAEAAFQRMRQESGDEQSPFSLAASSVWTASSDREEYENAGYSMSDMAIGVAIQTASASKQLSHEEAVQAELLRCIAGNPFKPVAFDPRWRTETAVALASAIYADRAFDRLPILADALEEAGCDHPDILTHCRGPGPHARGCWVVDLVLGKE